MREWEKKRPNRIDSAAETVAARNFFAFFSSALLHLSQTLCSLAASLQQGCAHSLPWAIALSQQEASFWHFSQVFLSLCASTQHLWSHSLPAALAFTQQL